MHRLNKSRRVVRNTHQPRSPLPLDVGKLRRFAQPKYIIVALILLATISFIVYHLLLSQKWRDWNYAWGEKNLSQGKFSEAAKNFETAAVGDKENDALYKLAVSKYNQKDYEGAEAAYRKVVENDTSNAAAYNGLGNLYRDEKNLSKAEENYSKAVALNGSYVVAYSNWAIMLMDNGKNDEAKKIVSDGLGKNPGSVELKNLKEILEQ